MQFLVLMLIIDFLLSPELQQKEATLRFKTFSEPAAACTAATRQDGIIPGSPRVWSHRQSELAVSSPPNRTLLPFSSSTPHLQTFRLNIYDAVRRHRPSVSTSISVLSFKFTECANILLNKLPTFQRALVYFVVSVLFFFLILSLIKTTAWSGTSCCWGFFSVVNKLVNVSQQVQCSSVLIR